MQKADVKDETIAERNRLAVIVVVLVALAIVNSLAFKFPSAEEHLIGQLFIGNAIKAGTLVIMLILIMPLRYYLDAVIRYYTHSGVKVDERADRAKVGKDINSLSNGLANVVAIAIAWPVVLQLVNQLLLIEGSGSLDWIDIIINVSFALFLAYYVIITFGSFLVVLGVTGKKSQAIPCPKCGTSNSASAKFCISCGQAIHPPQTATASSRCTKCGTTNRSGAKFCENCGNPLAGTKPV
jgi:hypothetical protein